MAATGPKIANGRDYRASWSNLRARERVIWWAGTSFVPIVALLLIALPLAVAPLSPRWIVVLSGTWLAIYVAASRYRQRFRCPRCSHRFFERDQNADACPACHLPLGASRDDGRRMEATRR